MVTHNYNLRPMYKYKLSYVDLHYQNRKIVTLYRTNRRTVEKIRATVVESGSYVYPVKKSVEYSQSECMEDMNNHDPFQDCYFSEELINKPISTWSGICCHYSQNKDEIPLYTNIMEQVTYKFFNYPIIMKYYFFGTEITKLGGTTNICNYIILTKLSTEQIKTANNLFNEAVKQFDYEN